MSLFYSIKGCVLMANTNITSSDIVSKGIDRLKNHLDGNQTNLYKSIEDNLITCCNARAGTGKTTVATLAAFDLLLKGIISKIYYIRFPDQLMQSLGAVPGELDQKEFYYFQPFYQACEEIDLDPFHLERDYIPQGTVKLDTVVSMRGTNISDAAVIIDEAQNASFKDLKLVLTRMHDDCHIALIGHSDQIDNPNCVREKAFIYYIEHMCKKQWAQRVDLKTNYRGKISNWADSLMLDEKGKPYIIE